MTDQKPTIIAPFITLAIGMVVAAMIIAGGLKNFRNYDNYVSVKGLAEQDVEADLAIWTIKHTATGNDLSAVQKTVKGNASKIDAFLKSYNVESKEIASRDITVTDLMAQNYRQANAYDNRYIVTEIIVVRSDDIDKVSLASQNVGTLLDQNIVLMSNGNGQDVSFIFTGLNDIKPDMIERATENAREAADQFASDSGADVDDIKYANQGVFQILPRDTDEAYAERQSRYKTVRVVSTLQFYLE